MTNGADDAEREQGTVETEGTQETPSWFAWATVPVFGGASMIQIALLFAIGTVWSGSIWLIVDRVKDGLGLSKPYSQRTRVTLTFAPLGMSIVVCLAAFPGSLSLAGVPYETDATMFGAATGFGVLAWAAAKASHDLWGELLKAARSAVINRIRGLGGRKVEGYTTKGVQPVTPEQVEADRKRRGLDP